jgi:hypothetical protein
MIYLKSQAINYERLQRKIEKKTEIKVGKNQEMC